MDQKLFKDLCKSVKQSGKIRRSGSKKITECKTPWHDEKGELSFPYRPLRDLVFVWPDPPPEVLGKDKLIIIPEKQRKKYHNGIGTILAIGPGYLNDKGKFHSIPSELKSGARVIFDIGVPWGNYFKGQNGKEYYAVLCGVADIWGIVED